MDYKDEIVLDELGITFPTVLPPAEKDQEMEIIPIMMAKQMLMG